MILLISLIVRVVWIGKRVKGFIMTLKSIIIPITKEKMTQTISNINTTNGLRFLKWEKKKVQQQYSVNMVSEIFKKILEEVKSPEFEETYKQRRLDYKNSLTLSYQLGKMCGEIMVKDLPLLESDYRDLEDSPTYVRVSKEDLDRYDNFLSSHDKPTKEQWDVYLEFRRELENKYLKPEFVVTFNIMNIPDDEMEDFKRGVGDVLWHSDICYYNCDPKDIEVYDTESLNFTKIKLKLRKDDTKRTT